MKKDRAMSFKRGESRVSGRSRKLSRSMSVYSTKEEEVSINW